MKTSMVLVMIACVLLPPQQTKCQQGPPPDKDNVFVVGCIVIGMGGIIVYSLVTLCNHIPDPNLEPPPPPVTNTPITRVNWTNAFPPGWRGSYPPPGYVSPKGLYSAAMPAQVTAIAPVPFDTHQWQQSPMSGPRPPLVTNGVFDSYYSVTLESSTDLVHWSAKAQSLVYQCSSTNFFFEDGTAKGTAAVLVNTYLGRYDAVTNSVPIFSGYHSEPDGMCMIPPDCIRLDGDRPQEFFRWVQP